MAYKRKHPSKISEDTAKKLWKSKNDIGVRATALKFNISENSLYTYLWSWGYTKPLKLSNDEFLQRLSETNPTLTAISEYKSNRQYVLVQDKLGIIYKSTPTHLFEGKIPSLCSAVDKSGAFAIKARLVHGYRYDYSFVNYLKTDIKVDIICSIHGVFKQTPNEHLGGNGCPMCNKHNGHSRSDWMRFAKDRTCTVYLVEMMCNSEIFVKVGITSLKKITDRFYPKSTPYVVKSIFEIKTDAENSFNIEKDVHKKFSHYKYIPTQRFGGDRECFDYAIKETILSYMKKLVNNI
jgi:hypothetical protein